MKTYVTFICTVYFLLQLFEDYHVFKKPGLKLMSEKTPEAYEIDEMLDLDQKVIFLILFRLVNQFVV